MIWLGVKIFQRWIIPCTVHYTLNKLSRDKVLISTSTHSPRRFTLWYINTYHLLSQSMSRFCTSNARNHRWRFAGSVDLQYTDIEPNDPSFWWNPTILAASSMNDCSPMNVEDLILIPMDSSCLFMAYQEPLFKQVKNAHTLPDHVTFCLLSWIFKIWMTCTIIKCIFSMNVTYTTTATAAVLPLWN